ncbi:site-specific integrase [Candidatus Woesearchaeota archaeon]|nr:site-specific integrase [Candidatus Woesearchaeota archaeon]
MVGKAHLAREVMEFYSPQGDNEVRFIKEEDVRKISERISNLYHKALLWLAFDIGENIQSLLQLKKSNFIRQLNETTKEPEYRVVLEEVILKRTRTPRTEITLYPETCRFIDEVLAIVKDENSRVFYFTYTSARKFLLRASAGVRCIPKGQRITWKDLRSSMASHLLSKGWSTDEVNSRLGHKPSSTEIDKRSKTERKIIDNEDGRAA